MSDLNETNQPAWGQKLLWCVLLPTISALGIIAFLIGIFVLLTWSVWTAPDMPAVGNPTGFVLGFLVVIFGLPIVAVNLFAVLIATSLSALLLSKQWTGRRRGFLQGFRLQVVALACTLLLSALIVALLLIGQRRERQLSIKSSPKFACVQYRC